MGKEVAGQETLVCLRVVADKIQSPTPLLWYVVNLSDSLLQRRSKVTVRKMEKEARRRANEDYQKENEYYQKSMKRKFSLSEEKESDDPMLNPVWQTVGISEECFWTARKSPIFCLGAKLSGEYGYGNNFRVFDILDHASEEVKIGPPMIRKRRDGKAVTALDRIFVFGGERSNRGPWGGLGD